MIVPEILMVWLPIRLLIMFLLMILIRLWLRRMACHSSCWLVTKYGAWEKAPTQDGGRRGRQGRWEKNVAPVGLAGVDSKKRQLRLAVEFENILVSNLTGPWRETLRRAQLRGITDQLPRSRSWWYDGVAQCKTKHALSANGLGSWLSREGSAEHGRVIVNLWSLFME